MAFLCRRRRPPPAAEKPFSFHPSVRYQSDTAPPTLQACKYDDPTQQFRNDYTRIRNSEVPVELTTLPGGGAARWLTGAYTGGHVTTPQVKASDSGSSSSSSSSSSGGGSSSGSSNTTTTTPTTTFMKWTYFPNTFQLRNQYVASDVTRGYPLCLSACTAPAAAAAAAAATVH
jgi:hypothetical protein